MMAGAAHATISGRPATVLRINSIEEALKNAGDNFGGLCFIIGQYQLSTSYPNTPEEAKKLIQDYIVSLKSQIDSKKNELESTTHSSVPFMKKEREYQLKCKQLYEEGTSKLLSQKLFVKCCLELQCAGFENTLENERTMLEDDTMRILITGEVSSGKSSVVNMLMGGNFMASRRGHCTQVLCEVQHSPELKAVLYYDDTSLSPRSVDVNESEDDEIWEMLQTCMQTGEDVVTAAEQRIAHKLKFIRIHWKIPFMNEELYGVTFIDAPGFYDSDESFVYVHEAIKNAHAFVFVINTSQHTGVDKDRIKMLKNKALVKVCDFGLSRHEDMVKTVRYVGTIPYNAPEILAGKPNTFASDIYSLGLVIWELWYGEKVFKDLDDEQVKDPGRNPPRKKPAQSFIFKSLLNGMFQKMPEDRPPAHKVVTILKAVKEQFGKGDY